MAKNRAAERAGEQILSGAFEVKKQRKTFWENRTLAVAATVLAILVGTMFGAHRSVATQGKLIENRFSTGIQYEGYSIRSDLNDRMEYAQQLAKIAQRYDFSVQAQAVLKAADDLYCAGQGHECYVANRALSLAVEELNGELLHASLSQSDEQYRLEAYRNFVSCADTIAREAALYNELVATFNNEMLGAFPTGTLARLTGVEKLEAFE